MNVESEIPFKVGQRIRMVSQNDPNPIAPGTVGTVERIFYLGRERWQRERWQIAVRWDNGRALRLVMPPDVVEVVP